MKRFALITSLFLLYFQAKAQLNFHSFRVENIHGDSINLSDFAGKKLLVVNTAYFCGYTHQFTKLKKLDSMYQTQNFRVIGFPCNDFGGQDPYSDSTINSFCLNQYGISFPMMSKIFIRVGDTSMVYKWLQKKSLNGVANAPVSWNFNKFLIDENGNWKWHLPSAIEPTDTLITNWITSGTTSTKPKSKKIEKPYQFFKNDNGDWVLNWEREPKQIPTVLCFGLNGTEVKLELKKENNTQFIFQMGQPGFFVFQIEDGENQYQEKAISGWIR